MKFNVTTSCNTDVPTIITGVNDRVQVTFASGSSVGTFDNMQEKGAVRLAGGSGERWAILLPSLEGAATSLAYTGDLHYNGIYGPFPALANNDYLSDGFDVNLENALSGFTIKKDSTKVFFAPGNLQATTTNKGASWTFTFAENQYDVLGSGGANLKITDHRGNTTDNGTIDLFCWIGEHAGDTMNTYGIVNDYTREHYGNTYKEKLKSDWGNAVGNVYGRSWSLPDFRRFTYMLGFMQRKSDFPTNATAGGTEIYDHRSSSTVCGVANARYAIGQIQDSYHNKTINGLFIFPDVYTHPAGIPALQHINENPRDTVNLNYNDNNISLAEWTQMEAMGCAFLPATGVRDVDANGTLTVLNPTTGGYWQNSSYGIIWKDNGSTFNVTYNELKADMMFFGPECVYSNDHYHRSYGFGVRLVSD